MVIKKHSGPRRCSLCLQDADAEVARHLRENRPCTQPGCPLREIINAALEQKRRRQEGGVYVPAGIKIGHAIRPGSPDAKKRGFWARLKKFFHF